MVNMSESYGKFQGKEVCDIRMGSIFLTQLSYRLMKANTLCRLMRNYQLFMSTTYPITENIFWLLQSTMSLKRSGFSRISLITRRFIYFISLKMDCRTLSWTLKEKGWMLWQCLRMRMGFSQ